MTLFWELIIGVAHQPYQSKGCDKNGRHAQQSLSHYFIALLCLGDLYLREKVYRHKDCKLLSFSDKLCHLVRYLLRERRRNEEVKVLLIVRPHVGDRVLRDPPSLDYPCSKVSVLLSSDPDAVRGLDRVRKALQQFGQQGGKFQAVELLTSRHARERVC
jgi:hypothetical protein